MYINGFEQIMHSEEDRYKYGVPQLKKFPLPDVKHVKSAIRFFNYAWLRRVREGKNRCTKDQQNG